MTPVDRRSMSRNILFVAIGGMLGSVGRFLLVTLTVQLLPSTFPAGTLLVNIVGSFLMGAAVGLAERNLWFDSSWRIFVTAGFCGGFTTFSAFAFENVELILNKNYGTFALYSLITFVVCLLAALAGMMISRS
jgi:fluoride exporter